MYHELVPLEPQPAINKSSMFGYATSVYKVFIYILQFRFRGMRQSIV